jgi:hypothetical protein
LNAIFGDIQAFGRTTAAIIFAKSPSALVWSIPVYYAIRSNDRIRQLFLTLAPRLLPWMYTAGLVASAVLASTYFYFPDHSEPTVLVIGLKFSHGAPLYPDQSAGWLYGLGYGPVVFWLVAALWPLLGSPGAVRAAFAAMVGIGLCVYAYALLKRRHRDLGLLGVAAALGFTLSSYPFFCIIHPDPPFLVIALLAACCALFESEATFWSIIAGFLIGILAGLKINQLAIVGLLGLFPQRRLMHQVIAGVTAALTGAAIYFLASPMEFLPYVRIFLSEGVDPSVLLSNAIIVGFFWLLLLRFSTLSLRDWHVFLAFACAVALVVSGAKRGSAAEQLFPVVMFLIAAIVANVEVGDEAPLLIGLAAASLLLPVLTYSVPTMLWHDRALNDFAADRLAIIELTGTIGARNLMVLPAGDGTYEQSFMRYIPEVDSGPVLIDPVALMDFEFVGVNQSPTADMIKSCYSRYIIFPAGEPPLSMTNPYDKESLFAIAVREAFRSSYKLVGRRGRWDVYRCRGAASDNYVPGRGGAPGASG